MFGFLKKKTSKINFGHVKTDMHSHLIPGIDDGAQSLEDAVALIRGLQALGYEKIITTPHIYKEYYPNTSDVILRGLDGLRVHLQSIGIDIDIAAAAEYFMDEHFEALMKKGDLLSFGDQYVLVEMSFYYETPKVFEYIFELCSKGYRPILAHPERYVYYANTFDKYHDFKERGCLLQMNLLSLTGYYGKPVQQNALRLAKSGLLDFVGTDLHKERQLKALEAALTQSKVIKLLESKQFLNSLL
ncbi:MAG: CpsB/CapC family capsule biosynthesis tyrosine phosphatase [Bacteroidota bacterium]